jgi:hypothetical protein
MEEEEGELGIAVANIEREPTYIGSWTSQEAGLIALLPFRY